MASKSRGGLSAREYAAKTAGKAMPYSSSSSNSVSSGGLKAPKAPKTGSFKFDSSKLVPTYQAEAASIYNPQVQQIQGLQALTKSQAEDAKVKTKDEFAQLLKREQENINRRGAFFSGGAIDQENRIGAQEGGALRDIGFQEQSANLQYQGTLSEIAQAQKDYVSSKVEGAYSSAYKAFQDKIANQMNQYKLELDQYNTDRAFNQSKIESDRNYALSVASAARAGGGGAAGSNAELSATAAALKKTGGNWEQTAQMLADQGYDVSSGSVIDNELRRRNGLAPIVQKTAAEIKAEADQEIAKAKTMKEAEAVKAAMEDKLKKLNEVTGRGVGTGLTGAIERNAYVPFNSKNDNLNVVKSIVGKETLDTLIALKAQGGTLGAVSEKELAILESSGSVIGAAAIYEDGNIVGYNMSEGQFNKEIDRMKQAAQRLIDATKSYDVNNDPLGINI